MENTETNKEKNFTYDVFFNDNENSNNKGFSQTLEYCKNYIKAYNGTDESYFADYKGGIAQVICNETGEVAYEEEIKHQKEKQMENVTNIQQLNEKQFTQLNYLKNQVKYLGLGEDPKMHKDLENAILSPEDKTTMRVEYNHPDKLMKGNTVTFDLNIAKTEQGGVFLNSYRANLTTKNGEERSQAFKVQKENSITAKEAINLLEGRSVKIEHDMVDKETGELSRTESFIKLNMKEPKTEYGNYKYEWYNKGYGVDVDNIMQKSNLVFADDIQRERTKKHLEKGNITQATFMHENRQVQGFVILNPQWKSLNLYDSSMNRLTTQNKLVKPEPLQSQQKNNVPEHSITR